MRIVCDTIVLVSAFKFGGVPYETIILAIRNKVELVTSAPILFELATTMHDKFSWQETEITAVIRFLNRVSILVKPQISVKKASDPDDNRILECALEAKADYIVTGDKKHLLPLKKFKGIPILSPRDFLLRVLYKMP